MLLFHRDLGGAGNPPLVILHGMLGSSRNWQTTGRDLAAKYHVLAPELRNHGASPHAAEMTYPAMVDDVLRWLNAQGLARVTLVGHSMGGKVAMLLACRHPGRVAGLVVVDIAPKGYFWPVRREEFAAMNALDLASLSSRAAAEQLLAPRISDWGMRKFVTTGLERAEGGPWRWTFNLPVLSAALATMEGNPLGTADRYDGPALFVTGAKSPYVGPGDHAAIRAHFPAARIETIPGAGHNPHAEQRAAFVALVLTAL